VLTIIFGINYLVPDPWPSHYDSVVLITSIGCKSSPTQTVGTVIGKDLIVTVAHGVAGQTSTSITTIDGQVLNAKVVAIDINLDLALLYVDSTKSTTKLLPLKFADAVEGSDARFVAFEDSQQFAISAKIKEILRIDTEDIYLKNKISRPGLEVETRVVVGNSGGPLINHKSEIVGLVWATSRTEKNLAWATRIEAADKLLALISSRNPQSATPQVVACTG
jgi:S1-C subfamily serine protease